MRASAVKLRRKGCVGGAPQGDTVNARAKARTRWSQRTKGIRPGPLRYPGQLARPCSSQRRTPQPGILERR